MDINKIFTTNKVKISLITISFFIIFIFLWKQTSNNYAYWITILGNLFIIILYKKIYICKKDFWNNSAPFFLAIVLTLMIGIHQIFNQPDIGAYIYKTEPNAGSLGDLLLDGKVSGLLIRDFIDEPNRALYVVKTDDVIDDEELKKVKDKQMVLGGYNTSECVKNPSSTIYNLVVKNLRDDLKSIDFKIKTKTPNFEVIPLDFRISPKISESPSSYGFIFSIDFVEKGEWVRLISICSEEMDFLENIECDYWYQWFGGEKVKKCRKTQINSQMLIIPKGEGELEFTMENNDYFNLILPKNTENLDKCWSWWNSETHSKQFVEDSCSS